MGAARDGGNRGREANKVRRQLQRDTFLPRSREREENTVKNIPPDRNRAAVRKEVTHQMCQKAHFQSMKASQG